MNSEAPRLTSEVTTETVDEAQTDASILAGARPGDDVEPEFAKDAGETASTKKIAPGANGPETPLSHMSDTTAAENRVAESIEGSLLDLLDSKLKSSSRDALDPDADNTLPCSEPHGAKGCSPTARKADGTELAVAEATEGSTEGGPPLATKPKPEAAKVSEGGGPLLPVKLKPKPPMVPPPAHLLAAAKAQREGLGASVAAAKVEKEQIGPLPVPPPPPPVYPNMASQLRPLVWPLQPYVVLMPMPITPTINRSWSGFLALTRGSGKVLKLFATLIQGDANAISTLAQATNGSLCVSHRVPFTDLARRTPSAIISMVPLSTPQDQALCDEYEAYFRSKDRAGVAHPDGVSQAFYVVPPSSVQACGFQNIPAPACRSLLGAVAPPPGMLGSVDGSNSVTPQPAAQTCISESADRTKDISATSQALEELSQSNFSTCAGEAAKATVSPAKTPLREGVPDKIVNQQELFARKASAQGAHDKTAEQQELSVKQPLREEATDKAAEQRDSSASEPVRQGAPDKATEQQESSAKKPLAEEVPDRSAKRPRALPKPPSGAEKASRATEQPSAPHLHNHNDRYSSHSTHQPAQDRTPTPHHAPHPHQPPPHHTSFGYGPSPGYYDYPPPPAGWLGHQHPPPPPHHYPNLAYPAVAGSAWATTAPQDATGSGWGVEAPAIAPDAKPAAEAPAALATSASSNHRRKHRTRRKSSSRDRRPQAGRSRKSPKDQSRDRLKSPKEVHKRRRRKNTEASSSTALAARLDALFGDVNFDSGSGSDDASMRKSSAREHNDSGCSKGELPDDWEEASEWSPPLFEDDPGTG